MHHGSGGEWGFKCMLKVCVCVCVCGCVCVCDRQPVIYFLLIPCWRPSPWEAVWASRAPEINASYDTALTVCVCVCVCVLIARFMVRITSIDLNGAERRRVRDWDKWGRDGTRGRDRQVFLLLYLNVNQPITGGGKNEMLWPPRY